MSKYRRIEVEFRSEEALLKALADCAAELGIKFEDHRGNPAHLIGYQGDTRAEEAEFIVRRRFVGLGANDLGFARKVDGSYEMILSDYDGRRAAEDGTSQNRLVNMVKQRYAYHATYELAWQNGWSVTEEVKPDGTIELELYSYA
ncbi:MAG: DUF1257 domain-containing protein [Anaerolineae bacterium]|nr:DUF1257 domain-containing protein [Anaerolineae bacterium]